MLCNRLWPVNVQSEAFYTKRILMRRHIGVHDVTPQLHAKTPRGIYFFEEALPPMLVEDLL